MAQKACYECGKPSLTMMLVRGPMASKGGAVERGFCSLKCFWAWVEKAREDRAEGGRLPGPVKPLLPSEISE